MPRPYVLELSAQAETVYRRLSDDAQRCIDSGDETNSKVTQLRMVDEALDRIIPHDPFARDRALAGPLAGIYRVKKGRIRICYIGRSDTRRIIVLYISDTPRKQGDVNDPYKVITRMVTSGKLDHLFEKVRLPRKLQNPEARRFRTNIHPLARFPKILDAAACGWRQSKFMVFIHSGGSNALREITCYSSLTQQPLMCDYSL